MLKIIFIVFLLLPYPLFAAENYYINLDEPKSQDLQSFSPGTTIILPDGRQAIIEEILQDGNFRTDLGVIITPEGTIAGGNSDEKVRLPESNASIQEKKAIITEMPQQETRVDPRPDESVRKVEIPVKQPETITPESVKPDERQLTLAELLPLTAAGPKQKEEQKKPLQNEKPAPKAEKQEPKKQEQKPEPRPEAKPKAEPKPKIGQELHIPPEAAKTGNLDFLEGCWQGTRPEYYSKRTIRECFCFGANGKNGKRRVIDPKGNRMCIGASTATLSKNGVLSVTSKGAACNDGERWGQAEMVCQNSGPKTPCSWVFRDANNGRQSYSIPFVRVEACGK